MHVLQCNSTCSDHACMLPLEAHQKCLVGAGMVEDGKIQSVLEWEARQLGMFDTLYKSNLQAICRLFELKAFFIIKFLASSCTDFGGLPTKVT